MSATRVSIITPTYQREDQLRSLQATIAAQTHSNYEWLILDDSPVRSEYFSALDDPAVTYLHAAVRRELGEKRNLLVERATGEVIAHFDDDDYYAPEYLATMLDRMTDDIDMVKLSGWFLYSTSRGELGYWDLTDIDSVCFRWEASGATTVLRMDGTNNALFRRNYLGFGFSFVYRRSLWQSVRFTGDLGEDQAFAEQAERRHRLHHFADRTGLCLHVLHRSSSSACLPQYRLPNFMLQQLFPATDIGSLAG